MLKIGFVGCIEFSERCLEALHGRPGVNLAFCVSQDANKFNADWKCLRPAAEARGIPYYSAKNINEPEAAEFIRQFAVDYIFVFGWSQLLKSDALRLPRRFCVGVHGTKLPENRGRHPLIWARVLGLPSTAISFFRMNEKADEGDVVLQKEFPIGEDDTARDIYERATEVVLRSLDELVAKLDRPEVEFLRPAGIEGNVWRKRSFKDGVIDFRMGFRNIKNLVLALSDPYPGAQVSLGGSFYKVSAVEPSDDIRINHEFGRVERVAGNTIIVRCGDGAVALTKHEVPLNNLIPGSYFD